MDMNFKSGSGAEMHNFESLRSMWPKVKVMVTVCLVFGLSGCMPWRKQDQPQVEVSPTPRFTTSEIQLDDVLKSKQLIALRAGTTLLLVDPEYGVSLPIYEFKPDELPLRVNATDLRVSASKNWIVWYTAAKGVLSLDVRTKHVYTLFPASDWLNTNPYLEMDEGDHVYFTSDGGLVLNAISLVDRSHQKITIPYPFGNVFRISPDGTKVLFTSGYAQDNDRPEFMFTDLAGSNPRRFKTDTELFIRHVIEWTPDNTMITMLEGNGVTAYAYDNPEKKVELFKLTQGARGIDLERIGKLFYVKSDIGYWHVFDYDQRKEIGRTPAEIAAELRQPQFFPWSENEFLITETMAVDNTRYSRLWLSNLRGSKKLLVPKFGETVVNTEDVKLE